MLEVAVDEIEFLLFFQCALETFAREWPTVDIHRQSKFMYMIRQTIQ